MRFSIICLMSLLLAPALASEQQRSSSLSPSPPPPYRAQPPPYLERPPPPPKRHPPPRPGNTVYFQGPNGPQAGIALASRPDRQGHYDLAPFAPLAQHPDGHLVIHRDRIVKAHPGDVVTGREKPLPQVASDLVEGHARIQPQVSYASGPIHGSPNYVSEHGGRRRPGRSGGHGQV